LETCEKCNKEFDPEDDFMEDADAMVIINEIVNEAKLCGDCYYDLWDNLGTCIIKFLGYDKEE